MSKNIVESLKDLYIVGIGDFCREVIWLVERINKFKLTWNLKGLIVDNFRSYKNSENKYFVVGNYTYFGKIDNECWVVCVNSRPTEREKIVNELKKFPNVRFATLVDPSVILSDTVEIGEGSIICAGTIITVDIAIGEHVIINLDCTIGHDSIIEDFVTINPSVNVSGKVCVKSGCEIGTGTHIIQGKHIGSNTIIGAGATVVSDIPDKCVAVGCPAKPVKFL